MSTLQNEAAAAARFASTAAIVLAGGQSTRMGNDKRLLFVNGRPLVQHVCDQVRPHFGEVLVAANDAERLAFLDLRIVPDPVPGKGPLAAIVSASAAARHDTVFVVACDVPCIDLALMSRLCSAARRHDGAVPITVHGHYEPLFAVYGRGALAAMRETLARGSLRITDAFSGCRIKALPLPEDYCLRNLNTLQDYDDFVAMLPRAASRQRPPLGVA